MQLIYLGVAGLAAISAFATGIYGIRARAKERQAAAAQHQQRQGPSLAAL